jgi:hypothetical protein
MDKVKEQATTQVAHQRERAAERSEQKAAMQAAAAAHITNTPKWEYQVKRIGEDKQKGLLSHSHIEDIFNDEGRKGWELVTINKEHATFKRRLPN